MFFFLTLLFRNLKKWEEILWSTWKFVGNGYYRSHFERNTKKDQKITGPPVLLLPKHSTFFQSHCIKRQRAFLNYYQLGDSFKAASLCEVYLLITRGDTVFFSPPSFYSIWPQKQFPIKSHGTTELGWRKLCTEVFASFEFQKFWSLIFTLL